MDRDMEGNSTDNYLVVFSNSNRVTVTNPQKIGTFITSFVSYHITSVPNENEVVSQSTFVTRRFNDFILLYEKLYYKYAHVGRIIPPPPEKDFGGKMSVMVAKEADISHMNFVERRRAALERFLNRLSSHRIIKEDIFFKLFLESKTNYKETVGNFQKKNNIRGSFHGFPGGNGLFLTIDNDDDSWFERKPAHLEFYHRLLKMFSEALHEFFTKKTDISGNLGDIERRVRMISSHEENPQFSALLNKIAEGYNDIQNLFLNQSEKEITLLSEVIKDYAKFTSQAKAVFQIRTKAFRDVQQIERELESRRQKELDITNTIASSSTVNKYKRLREQSEERLERYTQIYLEITRTIKEEVAHFEQLRVKELRAAIRLWISNSANTEQQMINIFKDYLTIEESAIDL